MKVFKLAKAELKKIFLRPIMPLVFLVLLVSTFFLITAFAPEKRVETSVYVNKTAHVQTIYNDFLNDSNPNSKSSFDNIVIEPTNEITNFFENFDTEEGQIEQLTQKVSHTKNSIRAIHSSILNYNQTKHQTGSTPLQIEAARAGVVNAFNNVLTNATEARNYYLQIHSEGITFFITEEDNKTISNFLRSIQEGVPQNFPASADDVELFQRGYKFLNEDFDFNIVTNITNKLEYFHITEVGFSDTLLKYSYQVLDASNLQDTSPTLNGLFNTISKFAQENAESTLPEHLEQMETYISQYKSIAVMSSSVLESEFELAKVNNIKDSEIKNYMGFIDFNVYNLKQVSLVNKYLLENNLYDYDYLNSFSYNQNSGQNTNAFDFVVYAMQILTAIIIVFAIFIASGTVANEQNSGTMKMLAIRPYSRGKIITAKLLSVLYFAFIILFVSFTTTFALGYISYGIDITQSLLVFNAEKIVILNSFVVMAIYFVSLFLNIMFFATIALLVSVLAKSNTIAIIITLLLYVFSIIGNTILHTSSWFYLLPIAHLDLFKFFGSASANPKLFGFAFPLNSNFYLSLSYLLGTALLSYIITISVFKRRNIA